MKTIMKAVIPVVLWPVVRKPNNANPRLKVKSGFLFLSLILFLKAKFKLKANKTVSQN